VEKPDTGIIDSGLKRAQLSTSVGRVAAIPGGIRLSMTLQQ
jgi:hypothetical protein